MCSCIRCLVPTKDTLSAYDQKLVTTARVDRAPDQFVKYCLANMQSQFDINDSGTFPRSTSDRRLLWMFALDLSASSILPSAEHPNPGPKKHPGPGPKKRARTAVVRQYAALAEWAKNRYQSLGSILDDVKTLSWTEFAAWLQTVRIGFQDHSLVQAHKFES